MTAPGTPFPQLGSLPQTIELWNAAVAVKHPLVHGTTQYRVHKNGTVMSSMDGPVNEVPVYTKKHPLSFVPCDFVTVVDEEGDVETCYKVPVVDIMIETFKGGMKRQYSFMYKNNNTHDHSVDNIEYKHGLECLFRTLTPPEIHVPVAMVGAPGYMISKAGSIYNGNYNPVVRALDPTGQRLVATLPVLHGIDKKVDVLVEMARTFLGYDGTPATVKTRSGVPRDATLGNVLVENVAKTDELICTMLKHKYKQEEFARLKHHVFLDADMPMEFVGKKGTVSRSNGVEIKKQSPKQPGLRNIVTVSDKHGMQFNVYVDDLVVQTFTDTFTVDGQVVHLNGNLVDDKLENLKMVHVDEMLGMEMIHDRWYVDETYKTVGLFNGRKYSYYLVTTRGVVLSLRTMKYLQAFEMNDGLKAVMILDDASKPGVKMNEPLMAYVDELVMHVYSEVPRPSNSFIVRVNGNLADNRVANLKYEDVKGFADFWFSPERTVLMFNGPGLAAKRVDSSIERAEIEELVPIAKGRGIQQMTAEVFPGDPGVAHAELMVQGEVWDDVGFYCNMVHFSDYQASFAGRVRRKSTGRVLVSQVTSAGHHQICMYDDEGYLYALDVNRVVCWTFQPEGFFPFATVKRRNMMNTSGAASNLCWAMADPDIFKDADAVGRHVLVTSTDGQTVEFCSIRMACFKMKVTYTFLSQALQQLNGSVKIRDCPVFGNPKDVVVHLQLRC
ncbi:hypothetical protein DM01DRAFT_1404943 [Hesseltinella vesiculosa]|uniref:Uncharacterized protein n=1 Tax=Hesseltinella vesiculosa TaxID=101127 RepID=A0A1X2GTD3_9FUNG|nr:hypothetical protein DM01DRAFT_1404943 [Hesseltinella vesiculosa]